MCGRRKLALTFDRPFLRVYFNRDLPRLCLGGSQSLRIPGFVSAGGIGVFSSIDDIAEFKVLTYSYSAEYGSRAGPTVLVTTKSGTNDFHGSLFEFVRNTAFDAKGDFDTTTPKFNLNQFGGSIGGPILHN